MSKLKPIIEGYVKYRDGKKWKQRYCFLCLSSKSQNTLHLYLGKNYDEFSALRSQGNSYSQLTDNAKSSSTSCSGFSGGSKSSVNVFKSLTDNYYRCNYVALSTSPNNGTNSVASNNKLNSVTTALCNQVNEACRASLSQAVAQARSLNCPPPVDVVTGFESGCHIDHESNVMLLIGQAVVHVIAHQTVDEMFAWAETLKNNLIDSSYHVTLCSVSGESSCKLPVGLQASMHVQQWRICLVGEPSAGCKFICQWRLDAIDSAYTVQPSLASASGNYLGVTLTGPGNGATSSSLTPGNAFSASCNASGAALQYGGPDNERFFLHINKTNSKTPATTYIFQVEAHRLEQFNHAIEELFLRRFPTLPPVLVPSSSSSSMAESYSSPEPIFSSSSPSNRSNAIDIRSGSISGDGSTRVPTASSLSPSTGLHRFADHRSPATPPGVAASSFPNDTISGGDFASLLSGNQSFLGHIKSGNRPRQQAGAQRKLFGAYQTLERSDAIKIPGGTPRDAVEKDHSQRKSSSKTRTSVPVSVGSAGSESSTKSENSAPLIYPSVRVGAGIITSLTPTVASSNSLASRISDTSRGGYAPPIVAPQPFRTANGPRSSIGERPQRISCVAPTPGFHSSVRELQQQQQQQPPPRPKEQLIPHIVSESFSSSASPGNYCDECAAAIGWQTQHQRRMRKQQCGSTHNRPRSVREDQSHHAHLNHHHQQEMFAADEDVDSLTVAPPPQLQLSTSDPSVPQSKHVSCCENQSSQSLMYRLGQMFQSLCAGISPRLLFSDDRLPPHPGSVSGGSLAPRANDRSVYALSRQLVEVAQKDWSSTGLSLHRRPRNRPQRRCVTPDEVKIRRDELRRRRISNILGADGSPLDLLLQRIIPAKENSSCLFLITFWNDSSSILVHRTASCCSRCCPHSSLISLHQKAVGSVDPNSSSWSSSLRKSSLPSSSATNASVASGDGFCLEGHQPIPCLHTSRLSIYHLEVKQPGKTTIEGVATECQNKANHQPSWSVILLSDFIDPAFEWRMSIHPPISVMSNLTTTTTSFPSSPPTLEVDSSNTCDRCGTTIPVAANNVQSKQSTAVVGAPPTPFHEYANFELCTRASTLPWNRGAAGAGGVFSSSANSTMTTVKRQTLQQVLQQQPRSAFHNVRSDCTDERKRNQIQSHPSSCTTSLSCSVVSQASSPNSPPSSSYCNIINVVLPSSTTSSGTSRLHSRPTVEQQAAAEASNAYVNWSMLISRGSGSFRRGFPRSIRIRSSNEGVPPPMPSGRLHPESPSLRRSYCCPSTATDVPDEVRDPKRNYALVDLRPSPASSVFAPSELQIAARPDSSASANADSSASTLRGVSIPSEDGEDRQSTYHRRHSHSLSSALPEPTLNYVHVITTGNEVAKQTAPVSASREVPIKGSETSVPCDSGGEISTSTSSGGEFAGHSIMTDSATSSGGSQRQPQPPAQSEVAYAQIDFVRTCALSSVNGNLEHLISSTTDPGADNNSGKGMRSNQSKGMSRSLRMMVKSSKKKPISSGLDE